eukprot:scaffold431_cov334-Pavlova_lutheri.AAC.112
MPHFGMSVAGILSCTSQGDPLHDGHSISHDGRLPDDDPLAMIQQHPLPDAGSWMNVHAEFFAHARLQSDGHHLLSPAPERVGDPVCLQCVESFEVQQGMDVGRAGWIPVSHRQEVASQRFSQVRIRCQHFVEDLLQLRGEHGRFGESIGEHEADDAFHARVDEHRGVEEGAEHGLSFGVPCGFFSYFCPQRIVVVHRGQHASAVSSLEIRHVQRKGLVRSVEGGTSGRSTVSVCVSGPHLRPARPTVHPRPIRTPLRDPAGSRGPSHGEQARARSSHRRHPNLVPLVPPNRVVIPLKPPSILFT